ncbi:hypothetical protein [Methylobacterium aerolatum]|uniref:Resolvase/invertase-type recombinase catalytic domain-containing protein n=1 Tax=Methylobacterium aerolatum TaxID=418708 RepID=A0ABU0I806_9HYPH|nr:hypothetical protein [Methylobacterium aerolatum]MDQ0449816.1 hypothetical protein [Methylobacterium aerolatum]
MDYGYDLAALVNSGLKDERDAQRRIIKRLKAIAKTIERSEKIDISAKMQIAISVKDARRTIDQMMHMIDLAAEQGTPKWVFKFRLMRLVDTMLEVGSHNGAGYAGLISSENANTKKSKSASDKNAALRQHIIAEAADLGQPLRNSKQLAQDLEAGVCRRANKSRRDRGYGWRTIQRQIAEILDADSAISGNGTPGPLST